MNASQGYENSPTAKIVHVADLYTDQEKKVSRCYNETLPPTNTQDSLTIRMNGSGCSRIIWTIGDPIDSGGWCSTRIETIRRLLPHLRHFVNQRQMLVDAGAVGWVTGPVAG